MPTLTHAFRADEAAVRADEDTMNALSNPLSFVGRRNQYRPGSRSDVIQVIKDWLEDSTQLTFWMQGNRRWLTR